MELSLDRINIGTTDPDWFSFLRARPDLTEVNFWRPGNSTTHLARGTPWFYRERGTRYIVGCGFFSAFTSMPVGLAWDTFEAANGFDDLQAFRAKMAHLQKTSLSEVHDIGCVVLSNPIYFAEPIPFETRIYGPLSSLAIDDPRAKLMMAALSANATISAFPDMTIHQGVGKPRVIVPRLGQGTFRVLVTDAYGRKCAVTGEKTLPALEAAHIKPFSIVKEHDVRNGLLLRSDLHRLYDQGYVSIQPDLKFRVSRAIRDEFENGRDYYALNGQSVRPPANSAQLPIAEHLEWHYETLFKG
ncbi:MAG: HNH endonuclease [Candidatus Eremiobacteraeota bacterium]|nr:HNH endonuclease [Candidatus Eremiobacteraeota bacterium]